MSSSGSRELKPLRFERDSQHEKGEYCLNCGTELSGPYCYYCGQPDKRLMVFLPALLREIAEDFFDFDSRFFRTLKPLLLKPGELTSSYIAGRRARYSPPWRLYLISSLLFFLFMALSANFDVNTSSSDGLQAGIVTENADIASADGDPDPEAQTESSLSMGEAAARKALAAISRHYEEEGQSSPLSEERAARLETDITRSIRHAQSWDDEDFTLTFFGDEAWDRDTNPVIIPLLPDRFNTWLNDEIARSPEKAEMISEDPDVIVEQVFDILPIAIFILLPVFALLLKLFYAFAGRYYIEHLIFALHNHAFIYVAGIVIWVLELFSDLSNWGWLDATVKFAVLIFMLWLPIYFWIAMYRVYRQNWFLTTLKYLLVGFAYLNVLMFSIIGVMMVAFLKV